MTAAWETRAAADEQIRDERRALLVEPRGRLVEQHDVGVARERARDGDPLALARREAIGRAVDAVGQAESLEPGAGLGLVSRGLAAVLQLEAEHRVLERRREREEAGLLAHPADVLAAVRGELLAVEAAELDAGDGDRAGIRALEARDQMQQRGLAGARAPLDRDQPAARHARIEALQHLMRARGRRRSSSRFPAARR